MKADILGVARPAAPFPDADGGRDGADRDVSDAASALVRRRARRRQRWCGRPRASWRQAATTPSVSPRCTAATAPRSSTFRTACRCRTIRGSMHDRRARLKASLGFDDRPVALFVGSDHGPNHDAADILVATARARPNGRSGSPAASATIRRCGTRPPPILCLGVVSEAELTALFRAADVGVNPMRRGSGTNLKMLDYAAHGTLVLSTEIGARGLGFVAGDPLRFVRAGRARADCSTRCCRSCRRRGHRCARPPASMSNRAFPGAESRIARRCLEQPRDDPSAEARRERATSADPGHRDRPVPPGAHAGRRARWPFRAGLLLRDALEPGSRPARGDRGQPQTRAACCGRCDRCVRCCAASSSGISRPVCAATNFAFYFEPNYIPFATDLPTIITIHDLSHLRHPETHPVDAGAGARSRTAVRDRKRPPAYLTVSDFTRREIITTFGTIPERVVTTPLGVDPRFLPQAPTRRGRSWPRST